MTAGASGRTLLILDMSYTLSMFRERQLLQALESRTLEGYFDKVISVHPLAALFEAGGDRFGAPTVTRLSDSQVFIEGKLGLTSRLRMLPPLNFLLAQISLIRFLLRTAREANVSVVRVGDPYYLGVVGWVLARVLDVPLAIRVPFRYDEIRRITGRATMPRLLRWCWVEKCIERFVFPRCDLIAGANEDNMRYALENGGRPDVATVFRYGNLLYPTHWRAPEDRPAPDAELDDIGLNGTRFVITIARLEKVKRVEDAIRVVGELVRHGCDVRGLVVGDGAVRQDLEAFARAAGLERSIVFAGNRPQEWIARVLPKASVTVSPHMGRALVEASLAGVPIVAYDYDWQREVAIDDDTGYLIPNGDWEQMAEKTYFLLTHPDQAAAMGRNARRKMATMMDPETLMRHEQGTYTRLLEQWSVKHLRPQGAAS